MPVLSLPIRPEHCTGLNLVTEVQPCTSSISKYHTHLSFWDVSKIKILHQIRFLSWDQIGHDIKISASTHHIYFFSLLNNITHYLQSYLPLPIFNIIDYKWPTLGSSLIFLPKANQNSIMRWRKYIKIIGDKLKKWKQEDHLSPFYRPASMTF